MARSIAPIARLLGTVLLTIGCSPDQLIVGTQAEAPVDAGLDAALLAGDRLDTGLNCPAQLVPPGSPAIPSIASTDQAPSGSWRGSLEGLEAEKFPATQLQLTLSLTEPSSLRLLTETSLPAIGDGSGGFLCPAISGLPCTSESGLVGGYDYPLQALTFREQTVAFGILLDSPWQAWCALQIPQVQPSNNSCPARYSVEPPYDEILLGLTCSVQREQGLEAIDCNRLATVEHAPCQCNNQVCWASSGRRLDINLRRSSAEQLQGSLWFDGDHALVLRLQKLAEQ